MYLYYKFITVTLYLPEAALRLARLAATPMMMAKMMISNKMTTAMRMNFLFLAARSLWSFGLYTVSLYTFPSCPDSSMLMPYDSVKHVENRNLFIHRMNVGKYHSITGPSASNWKCVWGGETYQLGLTVNCLHANWSWFFKIFILVKKWGGGGGHGPLPPGSYSPVYESSQLICNIKW